MIIRKFIFLFLILKIFSSANAEDFFFETKNIEIIDNGNLIIAGKGSVFSNDKNIEIQADKFEYLKENKILNVYGKGIAIIKSKNIVSEFNNAKISLNDNTLSLSDGVKIYHTSSGFEVQTKNLTFNNLKNTVSSKTKSKIFDLEKNVYTADSFLFEISKNLIKVNNLSFTNKDNDKFETSVGFINLKTRNLFGKDIVVNLNEKNFDKDNQPRLKGNSIEYDKDKTVISKGVFTTCKKRDGCPPWKLTADTVIHDKKRQVVNYDDAVLSVYDVPILYFPKFFHPDPDVKRKSGFLVPGIQSSSNSSYFKLPYFWAISDNKDATLSPRFYSEEKILIQNEFRQINSNNYHVADLSLFHEKNHDTENHFFYNLSKNFNSNFFDENELNFKLQHSSNDTYLKKNKIKSPLIENENILENSLNLDMFSNDFSLSLNTTIFEDLNKSGNDRYEYILPNINLSKKLTNNTKLEGDYYLNSKFNSKNYNTNINETTNTNDLIFKSNPNTSKIGFYNNYELIVRNTNSDSENSLNYSNNQETYLSGILQYNSSLPMINENDLKQQILKPKISLKIAPENSKKGSSESRFDVSNIYSLNRGVRNDSIEGGISAVIGNEYSIYDKKKSRKIINYEIANNIRFKDSDKISTNNQLNQKISNLFSLIEYNPNEYFKINYQNSLKNNLSDITYEALNTEILLNKFSINLDYLNDNQNNTSSFISAGANYRIDNSNSLSFSTRENKTKDLTEYYNFVYQYKNDCLAASIEYNKDYYSDRELKPEESIFFKLTIIPFGESSSPNLK
jgi:LPS-assembly protein